MAFQKGNTDKEPSMEEILASIRRIISKDTSGVTSSTGIIDATKSSPINPTKPTNITQAEFEIFPDEARALADEERLAAEWESFKRAEDKKYEIEDPDIAEFARAFHAPYTGMEVEDLSEEERRYAAEWEQFAEEAEGSIVENPPFDPPFSRVLNQDEIDSLLGYSEQVVEGNSGILALVNSSVVSYDRLPMLEVIFDRLCRSLSRVLREYTTQDVEVTLDNICGVRFGEYLNGIPLPAMFSMFKAEGLDGKGLLTMDSALIYSMVDVLLGGMRGSAAMRIEGRPYTDVERALMTDFSQTVLDQLTEEFSELYSVTFNHQDMETNPRFAVISRYSNACFLVKLRIDMEDRGGRMEFLLPYATLEPARDLLMQTYLGDKFGNDSRWKEHLVDNVLKSNTNVNAVLAEQEIELWRVLGLQIGETLKFDKVIPSGRATELELRVGDKTVGTATYVAVESPSKRSVKIEHILESEENV